MVSMSRLAMAAVLALATLPAPALSQWLVTPPSPPSEWRPVEIPSPQQQPGDPAAGGQVLPGAPGEGNGEGTNSVQQPNAGCPYHERKLELLV